MEATEIKAPILPLDDADIGECPEVRDVGGIIAIEHDDEVGFGVKSMSLEELEVLLCFGCFEVRVQDKVSVGS